MKSAKISQRQSELNMHADLKKSKALRRGREWATGGKGKENFPTLQTRDIVAEKVGIGSGKQYEKKNT